MTQVVNHQVNSTPVEFHMDRPGLLDAIRLESDQVRRDEAVFALRKMPMDSAVLRRIVCLMDAFDELAGRSGESQQSLAISIPAMLCRAEEFHPSMPIEAMRVDMALETEQCRLLLPVTLDCISILERYRFDRSYLLSEAGDIAVFGVRPTPRLCFRDARLLVLYAQACFNGFALNLRSI